MNEAVLYTTEDFIVTMSKKTLYNRMGNGWVCDFYFDFTNLKNPKKRLDRKTLNGWMKDKGLRDNLLAFIKAGYAEREQRMTNDYDFGILHSPLGIYVSGNALRVVTEVVQGTDLFERICEYLDTHEEWKGSPEEFAFKEMPCPRPEVLLCNKNCPKPCRYRLQREAVI